MPVSKDEQEAFQLIAELLDLVVDPNTYKKSQKERAAIADRMATIKTELETIRTRLKDVQSP